MFAAWFRVDGSGVSAKLRNFEKQRNDVVCQSGTPCEATHVEAWRYHFGVYFRTPVIPIQGF